MPASATPAVLPSVSAQVPTRLPHQMGLGGVPLDGRLAAVIGAFSLASGLLALSVAARQARGEVVPESHAPTWVLVGVGLLFTSIGAWFLREGVGQLSRTITRARRQQTVPQQPWLADFAWDRHGGRDRAPARLPFVVGTAAATAAFATSLAWAGFADGAGVAVRLLAVVVLIGAIRVGAWAARLTWRTVRWGRSRLRFADFPCAPGTDVEVIFDDLAPAARQRPLRATLRCVQQRWEVTPDTRSSDETTRLVHYALWRDTATVPPGARSVRFTLPADAPVTDLASRPARYWELEVISDVPGADYRACFFVPVYERDEG